MCSDFAFTSTLTPFRGRRVIWAVYHIDAASAGCCHRVQHISDPKRKCRATGDTTIHQLQVALTDNTERAARNCRIRRDGIDDSVGARSRSRGRRGKYMSESSKNCTH